MIGRLRGTVAAIAADHVLIDVAGVGYEVFCSDRTRAALPGLGPWWWSIPNWWCARI